LGSRFTGNRSEDVRAQVACQESEPEEALRAFSQLMYTETRRLRGFPPKRTTPRDLC
jgi:hypothetical protein